MRNGIGIGLNFSSNNRLLANTAALLNMAGGNFDGATTLIHEGPIGDYWPYPFVFFAMIQKTVVAQTVDFAMMERSKSTVSGDRITMTVRTGGYINFRLRKGDGTAGREVQTTAVAAVGDYVAIYAMWDGASSLSLVVNIIHNNVNNLSTVTSSTNVSLAADTDPSGIITLGNNYGATPGAGIYPWIGRCVAGGFKYGSFSLSQIQQWAAARYMPMDGEFMYAPGIYGLLGTTAIKEPHGRALSLFGAISPFWFGNSEGLLSALDTGDTFVFDTGATKIIN